MPYPVMLDKRTHWLVAIFVCATTALIYIPALEFQYVWDDLLWTKVLGSHNGEIFKLAFFEPFLLTSVYWRPLAELTLYVQPGDKPEAMQHALNILIHVVNIGLMLIIGAKSFGLGLLRSKKWFYISILFFALHPAFVEPIAWVSGRFDLLLTTCFLLLVLCILVIQRGVRQEFAIGVIFLVSLLIKETAVLLIPIYLGLQLLVNPHTSIGSQVKCEKRILAIMVLITMLWMVARHYVLGGTGAGYLLSNLGSIMTLGKVYMILSTVGAYGAVLVFPFRDLSPLYPVEKMLLTHWYAVAGVGYLVTMFWLLRSRMEARQVGVILALFLISLSLVLNIFEVGFTSNLIQNRYLYPALAIVIAGVFVSGLNLPLSQIGERAFTILAVVWLTLSIMNIRVTLPLWKDQETLSRWFYIENPDNPYAANMRGNYLLTINHIEEAIETAGRVAIHKPTHNAYRILGDGHYVLGKCKDAYVYYEYAYDMGGTPAEEVEGLLGMYSLKILRDNKAAKKIEKKIYGILANEKTDLNIAIERMKILREDKAVCHDEKSNVE